MFKVNINSILPSYKIDQQLLNLVDEIETLLKQVKISKNNSVGPLGYREKYSINDSNKLNFIKAYENMPNFDVFNKNDLLTINGLLTNKETHTFRDVKVYSTYISDKNKHLEWLDSESIDDALDILNKWYLDCKDHVLIKSCAYKVSFNKIHPFKDGNGRTSRYILTSLMSKYDDKLRYFPFEEIINDTFIRKFSVKLQQDFLKSDPKKDQDNCYRLIYFYLSLLRNKLKEVVTGVKPKTVFN